MKKRVVIVCLTLVLLAGAMAAAGLPLESRAAAATPAPAVTPAVTPELPPETPPAPEAAEPLAGFGGILERLAQDFDPASGAVGAFLYRRVLGVEPVLPGYKLFKFAPLVGGGLTEADGTVGTPYGEIKAAWHIENGEMTAEITVPMGTACTVTLPGGVEQNLSGGSYTLTARV